MCYLKLSKVDGTWWTRTSSLHQLVFHKHSKRTGKCLLIAVVMFDLFPSCSITLVIIEIASIAFSLPDQLQRNLFSLPGWTSLLSGDEQRYDVNSHFIDSFVYIIKISHLASILSHIIPYLCCIAKSTIHSYNWTNPCYPWQ